MSTSFRVFLGLCSSSHGFRVVRAVSEKSTCIIHASYCMPSKPSIITLQTRWLCKIYFLLLQLARWRATNRMSAMQRTFHSAFRFPSFSLHILDVFRAHWSFLWVLGFCYFSTEKPDFCHHRSLPCFRTFSTLIKSLRPWSCPTPPPLHRVGLSLHQANGNCTMFHPITVGFFLSSYYPLGLSAYLFALCTISHATQTTTSIIYITFLSYFLPFPLPVFFIFLLFYFGHSF